MFVSVRFFLTTLSIALSHHHFIPQHIGDNIVLVFIESNKAWSAGVSWKPGEMLNHTRIYEVSAIDSQVRNYLRKQLKNKHTPTFVNSPANHL